MKLLFPPLPSWRVRHHGRRHTHAIQPVQKNLLSDIAQPRGARCRGCSTQRVTVPASIIMGEHSIAFHKLVSVVINCELKGNKCSEPRPEQRSKISEQNTAMYSTLMS